MVHGVDTGGADPVEINNPLFFNRLINTIQFFACHLKGGHYLQFELHILLTICFQFHNVLNRLYVLIERSDIIVYQNIRKYQIMHQNQHKQHVFLYIFHIIIPHYLLIMIVLPKKIPRE